MKAKIVKIGLQNDCPIGIVYRAMTKDDQLRTAILRWAIQLVQLLPEEEVRLEQDVDTCLD